jgi:carboxylate-amine ligase
VDNPHNAFGILHRDERIESARPIHFHASPNPTIGVELEVQLIDPVTLDMAPKSREVIAAIPEELRDHFKHELFLSIVEVITPVCRDIHDVAVQLDRLTRALHRACEACELSVMGCGTHPFAQWRDQPLTPNPRYFNLVDRMGWVARRMLIMGTHVHVGVESGEKAVAIMNSLTCYLPHLLAISASSPYWSGSDTLLASSRLKVFELLPTAGLPPRVTNWRELVTLMRTLIAANAIETIREIWWDVRPHPNFGTIEIRVCDGLASPGEALVLTALIQTLVVYLGDLYDHGEQMPTLQQWTLKENKWRAARYADEAHVIRNEMGHQVAVRAHLESILEDLEQVAVRIGTKPYLEQIARVFEIGPSFRRQRAVMQRHNCQRRLVKALCEEFTDDTPLGGLLARAASGGLADRPASP